MTGRAEEANAIAAEAQVLELRKGGLSFAQIAPLVKPPYADASGAWRAFQRSIRRTVIGPATEQRDLMVLQLEQLWSVWYPKALGGDEKAQRTCERLMVRKARLLGLDAPTSIHMVVSDEMTAEIEKLSAELGVIDPTADLRIPTGAFSEIDRDRDVEREREGESES